MWAFAHLRGPRGGAALAARSRHGTATAILRRRGLAVPSLLRSGPAGATAHVGAGGIAAAEAHVPLPSAAIAHSKTSVARGRAVLPIYWKLSKGKLTTWVTISALPGYFLALPGVVDPLVLVALVSGTFLTSASAQTLNQIYEIKRDGQMKRTCQRPLPAGQISPLHAARFASASGALGLAILAVGATPVTAVVSAATIATYAAMYTPLKVVSPYNTHVGAISGSLPTMLGFTAALGAEVFTSPWAPGMWWLFCMQALWQMPHFYALAWIYRADYLKGGYKMFPLSDATGAATAAMSKPYLAALCALPWALPAAGLASWMLPIGAVVPSAFWVHSFRAFETRPTPATCRRFFLGSLSYLLGMLGLFAAFARPQKALGAGEEGPENRPGPMWRYRLHSIGVEVCPHEQADVRLDLCGTGRSRCPLSHDR